MIETINAYHTVVKSTLCGMLLMESDMILQCVLYTFMLMVLILPNIELNFNCSNNGT